MSSSTALSIKKFKRYFRIAVIFIRTPDWPLLVLEFSEAVVDVFLESSR